MGLEVYRRKRKFNVTPEPRGHSGRTRGNRFVIQKHAARRLHYDFRLELDGVMKSWAVTKGPSLIPGEKRLAVQTEDHPIEYNSFEGTIPQGEYGGGTVMIWDRGHWQPDGDPHKGLSKGHLDFALEGEKLHGRWHLVRMRRRAGESKDAWLLIKARDDEAREANDPDILEEEPLSVASGRSLAEIAEGKGRKRVWHSNRSVAENVKSGATSGLRAPTPERAQARTRQSRRSEKAASIGKRKAQAPSGSAALPDFVPPSLATLRAEAPSGAGWVHEIKFDGYRIQARIEHGQVQLLTRKGLDWTDKFPNVAAALGKLRVRSALIDGEIVVEDARGIASFSGLQAALKAGESGAFIYYVFDLLHLDGRDLSGLPLIERKQALKRSIGERANGAIRYSEHFEEAGPLVLDHACKMGLEGIVSKRADAPYRAGRSEAFIKTKCANAQEFVVGGYTLSTVLPRSIGALVVGYYERGKLIYAGRIGTGYSRAVAADLWQRLNPLERDKPPFDAIPREEARRRDIRWVEPRTVIESEFRGWTADRLVRQAAFKGVREDKPPQEVVREIPAPSESDTAANKRVAAASASVATKSRARGAGHPRSSTSSARTRSSAASRAGSSSEGLQRSEVRFTHPDRVYWVDVGTTKQDLADYYRAAWPLMAPHLIDRPLALLRCPDGTKGECFFQKHASAGLDDKYLKMIIDKNRRQVLAVEDLDGLLSLVQAGVLEVHVRGSRIDRLDICDRIVFDIDPGPDVAWRDVVAAARDVRARLAAIELVSFVKLSGGKGLHVVLPTAGADWETTKAFAQAVALAMGADNPERYVVKMTKSLRRGKLFIDYFRNSLEQTSVAAYSTRARPGAPVSVPVSWEELGRTRGGAQYTVLTLGKRLSGLKQDPWQEMGRIKQRLPAMDALRRN
ncbi:MAG TPA: DNA ligase D [Xanthobacteraceae bacterium]|jgi:bifunctional non-homologous end joining protein LigD